jgi:hypothetical protein
MEQAILRFDIPVKDAEEMYVCNGQTQMLRPFSHVEVCNVTLMLNM